MRGSQRSQCSVVQKAVLRRGQCLSGEGAQCVEFPGDCRRRVGVHAARKPLNHAGLLRYGLQKCFGCRRVDSQPALQQGDRSGAIGLYDGQGLGD